VHLHDDDDGDDDGCSIKLAVSGGREHGNCVGIGGAARKEMQCFTAPDHIYIYIYIYIYADASDQSCLNCTAGSVPASPGFLAWAACIRKL
jgi:hypothetical protein